MAASHKTILPPLFKENPVTPVNLFVVFLDVAHQGAPIRLVGGASPAEGRLQIFVNNTWGVVCDHYWTNVDSHVVCNQLGFYGNATTGYYGEFGYGSEWADLMVVAWWQ